MSSTMFPAGADAFSFNRTIADMKQGVASATSGQADMSQKAAQAGKDLVVFGQGNMEAIAQASQVLAAGSQDLFKQMAETAQSMMQEAMNSLRAVASAQTPKAMIEQQANFVRSSAIHVITESSRIAQSGVDLAERVSAPLVSRIVTAAEMAKSYRA